jgi:hypothetical protein
MYAAVADLRRTLILAMVVMGAPTWQPGRIHQLAKMKLMDLIALYLSMLPDGAEHQQAARMAAGGWTRDQVITAIRDLEAPYEEVGGWQRAMKIIGSAGGQGPGADLDDAGLDLVGGGLGKRGAAAGLAELGVDDAVGLAGAMAPGADQAVELLAEGG